MAMMFARLREVVGGLHPQPHIRTPAERLFEAQGHLQADGAPTPEHVIFGTTEVVP